MLIYGVDADSADGERVFGFQGRGPTVEASPMTVSANASSRLPLKFNNRPETSNNRDQINSVIIINKQQNISRGVERQLKSERAGNQSEIFRCPEAEANLRQIYDEEN